MKLFYLLVVDAYLNFCTGPSGNLYNCVEDILVKMNEDYLIFAAVLHEKKCKYILMYGEISSSMIQYKALL